MKINATRPKTRCCGDEGSVACPNKTDSRSKQSMLWFVSWSLTTIKIMFANDARVETAQQHQQEAVFVVESSSSSSNTTVNDNDNDTEAPNHHRDHQQQQQPRHSQHEHRYSMMRSDAAITRRKVLRRYYTLSTLAVVFALTCPETFLWKSTTASPGHDAGHDTTKRNDILPRVLRSLASQLDRPYCVARLLVIYMTTLLFVTFFLQASNPGYLTRDHIQYLDNLEQQHQNGNVNTRMSTPFSVETETHASTNQEPVVKQQNISHVEDSKHQHYEQEAMADADRQQQDNNYHDRLALLSGSPSDDDSVGTTRMTQQSQSSCPRTRRPACRHCSVTAPPLRSHHCKKCQEHVATFDHHCEFIGTCIGEANHARFWVFLTLQLYGFAMCVNIVASSPFGVLPFLFQTSATGIDTKTVLFVIACRMYLYFLTVVATMMWVMHTFLACTNSTTYEFVKGPSRLEYLPRGTQMMDLPFSRRLDVNLRNFLGRDAWGRYESWRPTLWQPPAPVERDSEDWIRHPWQNKYWSCC